MFAEKVVIITGASDLPAGVSLGRHIDKVGGAPVVVGLYLGRITADRALIDGAIAVVVFAIAGLCGGGGTKDEQKKSHNAKDNLNKEEMAIFECKKCRDL